ISFGYFFAFQILVPGDKNKEVFLSALTGVVVGLILNFMLVPHFKELGASIANAICELIVLLSYIRFAKKFIRLQFEWKL
ncbi:polysaccharide biosynthesis C-terminal domain-containing protein, partial [Acinetobacter baumannii]